MHKTILAYAAAAALSGCGSSGSHHGPDAAGGGDSGAADAAAPVVPGADPTFGDGGLVTVGFPGGIAAIMRVARQSDGKIVGVGGTEESIVIARVDANGTFDASFGHNGVVQVPWGLGTNGVNVGYGCAIQPDGKIVVAAHVFAKYSSLQPTDVVMRLSPDGTFDPTFAQIGYVFTKAGQSLGLDATGNIVVGGYGQLQRVTPAGAIDTTFGTAGLVTTNISPTYDLALQSDGKVIVVGGTKLARFTTSGAADSTFGTAGVVTVPTGQSYDQLLSIAVESDGSILVAGAVTPAGGTSEGFWIGKYTASGAPDPTFGTAGAVTGDSGGYGATYAVGVAPNGMIVGSGEIELGGMIGGSARFTASGVLDPAFGTSGRGAMFQGQAFSNVAFEPDGSFTVAGGFTDPPSLYAIGFARTTSAGAPDPAFGTAGLVKQSITGSFDRAHAVAFQPDGKLLVGGWAFSGGGAAVVRLNHDGSIDTTFANAGKLIESRNLVYVNSIAVQPSGKILICGLSGFASGGGNRKFVVERFDATGAPDLTFGTMGVGGSTILAGQDAVSIRMTVAPDGSIVVVGQTADGTNLGGQFGVLELTADGAPKSTFGTAGAVATTFPSSSYLNIATHALVQADGSIVVLGLAQGAATLMRFTPTGAVDTAFGQIALPASGYPFGLAQQADGSIVAVAGNYTTGDLVVARYSSNGVADATFGTAGAFKLKLSGNDYYGLYSFYGVALLPGGQIQVGLAAATADGLSENGILLRLSGDGTPDGSFGSGGIVTLAIGRGSMSINELALDGDGKLVAVGRLWTETGGSDYMALRFIL